MAVDRYLAVVNAINSRSYRTVRNSLVISILVWLVAILFSLQAYFLRTELLINDEKLNQTIHHCSWDFPGDDGSESYGFWLNFQYFTRTGFAFIVPIIIIGQFWKDVFYKSGMFLQNRHSLLLHVNLYIFEEAKKSAVFGVKSTSKLIFCSLTFYLIPK